MLVGCGSKLLFLGEGCGFIFMGVVYDYVKKFLKIVEI